MNANPIVKSLPMTATIFTTTTVVFLVLLSYAVKQLGEVYTDEMKKRQAYFDMLDALAEN